MGSETHSATILVVDDSDDIRDLLEVLLESEGYVVRLADDGNKALQMVANDMPDLILMDMSLPEMDGWAIVPLMRALPELATLPIIALTAHATPADENRAMAVGCTGYISKPFDADDILARIAFYLEHPTTSETAAAR